MQRRQYARVDLKFPIYCIFTDNELRKEIKSSGHVQDLSLGGMCIKVPVPPHLYNSHKLHYALHLPEPFNTITGQGTVKWSKFDSQHHSLLLGMAFVRMNEAYRKDIESILAELVDY